MGLVQWGGEVGVKAGGSVKIPLVSEGKVQVALEASYEQLMGTTDNSTTSNSYRFNVTAGPWTAKVVRCVLRWNE